MPTIQGREYQHATIKVFDSDSSFAFTKFKKLSVKVKAEKKPVKDSQGQIIDSTIGEMEIEASISMLWSEWQSYKDQVLSMNPGLGIGQVRVNWNLAFGNSPASLRTLNLIGVEVNEDPMDSDDGQEALVVEIPLNVIRVLDDKGRSFIEYEIRG
jgi:hypothetical protein